MNMRSKQVLTQFRAAARPVASVRQSNWEQLHARIARGDRPELAKIETQAQQPPYKTPRIARLRPALMVSAALAAATVLWFSGQSWRASAVETGSDGVEAQDARIEAPVRTPSRVDSSKPSAGAISPAPVAADANPDPSLVQSRALKPAAGRTVQPGDTRVDPGSSKSGPRSALSEELRLIKAAKHLLARGQGVRALVVLDEHARRFGNGILRDERWATVIAARCALGQVTQAAAAAATFASVVPESSVAQRLRKQTCATKRDGTR